MDPNTSLKEAIREISEARTALREGVVQSVMRRNRLIDEVTRVEQLVVDLGTKSALAEQINNPRLAAELREERTRRVAELEGARVSLATAEVAADSAKTNLPLEENRLIAQLNDLKARMGTAVGETIDANASTAPTVGSEPSFWTRASEKISDIRREASAREELTALGQGIAASAYQPQNPVAPADVYTDQNAEHLLAALESKLGIGAESSPAVDRAGLPGEPRASSTPDSAPTKANFLEFDMLQQGSASTNTPANAETPAPQSFQNIAVQVKGASTTMDPTQRVRVAAIGTGSIFQGAHLPCYAELIDKAQLVAFCDPDKKAQDAVMARYQKLFEGKIAKAEENGNAASAEKFKRDRDAIRVYEDISQIIDTVKPDLVDICTQPFLHTPLAIQALEGGLNVMCEKPISRSWLESQRLIEAVKRTGKLYQHNENWLFDGDYYTVKKLVDAGAIGELVMMFLTQAHGGPEGSPNFWNPDYGGGGALLDNGIHAIGAAWFVAGLEKTPTLVKAAEPFGMSIRMPQRIISGRYQTITVDDDAHILIRFEDKKTNAWSTAHVEGSWSHQDSPDTVYIGTTGSIKYKDIEGNRYAVVTDANGNEGRKIEVSGPTWMHWPSSFYGEIQNMVECVRHGAPSIMPAEFGADCSAIVGASYLSEKNGKQGVTLDAFKRFALDIAERYPNDQTGADNALVDALLSAGRK